MNKTQLVDALAARTGDRRTAAALVDGLIETIVDTVRAGGSVSLSGFGVFESRSRAARVARNPRTGAAVDVPATTVPAFRAGLAFRSAVGGGGQPAGRATTTRRTRSAPAATTPSAATEAAAVADAPAKVARGRSKVAVTEPPKRGRKATGRTAAAESSPAPVVAEAPPPAKATGKKSASDKASDKVKSGKGKKDDKSKSKKAKKK